MTESDLEDLITALCRIPEDFKRRGNVSAIELVDASGYLDHRGEVTVEILHERFASNPELIDAWEAWSDDNRSSPAWFVRERGAHNFEVGRMDRRGKITTLYTFDDRALACAEYVRREIDQLADHAEWWFHPWRQIKRRLIWSKD